MTPLKIERVTADEIRALVTGRVREGTDLDYKRELPGSSDGDKKEFLTDALSFAMKGGAIIFGISEAKDGSGKNTGFPEAIVGLGTANLDQHRLRLEQIMLTGIDPRLPIYRFHIVEGLEEGPVLVLVIGQSWIGAHMLKIGDSRFYARNSGGKYALDVEQIRSAFLQAEEVPDRIRRFRDERLGLIASTETPVSLTEGARAVVHVVPVSSVDRATQIDLHAWARKSMPTLSASRTGSHFNADGHVGYLRLPSAASNVGYIQLFRSGAVEAVGVYQGAPSKGVPTVNIWHIENQMVDVVPRYLSTLAAAGARAPVFVSLSLVGARGYGVPYSIANDSGGQPAVRRDVVVLPDILLDAFEVESPRIYQPIFDALWQTFEFSRSFSFDADGQWTPQNRIR